MLIVVIALVAILLAILVLLRRRSKALHSVNSIGNLMFDFESRRMIVKALQLPMYMISIIIHVYEIRIHFLYAQQEALNL